MNARKYSETFIALNPERRQRSFHLWHQTACLLGFDPVSDNIHPPQEDTDER